MKEIITILLLVFFLNLFTSAEKAEGYYIDKVHDTIHVLFNINIVYGDIPDFEDLQWGIYYLDIEKKKHLLKPDMADEIAFIYNDKKIRLLSVPLDKSFARNSHFLIPNRVTYLTKSPDDLPGDQIYFFLHCITDGRIKLFKYYHYTHDKLDNYLEEDYFLKKDSENIFRLDALFFKKNVLKQISDCPELEKKYSEKKFRFSDVIKICKEYNTICDKIDVKQ